MESSSGYFSPDMKLIFASSNRHKINEINALVSDLQIQVIAKEEIGCNEEIPETGSTLKENAILKANYIYERFQVPCFSEDTGLEVSALNNEPGVKTARYAGEHKDSIKNMEKLLYNLRGETNRSARFRTVIALYWKNELQLFEGIVEGQISDRISGKGGFGYDPVFIPEGYDKTFAELDLSIKNQISHRAMAVGKLVHFLGSNQ